MSALQDLAGSLRLRPGRPRPHNLRGTRRHWAEALARGRPAAGLPELLASLYSLCGMAHRQAATLALSAARGQRVEVREAVPAALQADTLREHLRRIGLEWPAGPGDEPLPPRLLASSPAFAGGAPADVGHWLAQHLLGMPAQSWWAAWQRHPREFLATWSGGRGRGLARWLSQETPDAPGRLAASRPLRVHASNTGLARLHADLQADPAFALQPLWQGRCADTGPWARLATEAPDTLPDNTGLRLGARLAEVVALCVQAEGDPPRLYCGSLGLAPGEGLGWVEMARGLLVHSVRLEAGDPQARVASYRVVAPTEWNFHPQGAVAHALEACGPPEDPALMRQRVRRLVAAYDPCVRFEVEPALEHCNA